MAVEPAWGVGKIINAFFDEFVEKNLIQPIFITGHPKEISPLAKSSVADPDIMTLFKESNVVQKTAVNYYFFRRHKETGVWMRIERAPAGGNPSNG